MSNDERLITNVTYKSKFKRQNCKSKIKDFKGKWRKLKINSKKKEEEVTTREEIII